MDPPDGSVHPDDSRTLPAREAAAGAGGESRRLVFQTLLGIALLGGVVTFLARSYGHSLEALGAGFVHRFGLAGFFLGTFAADAFHVPIPVQFYLLAVVTSRGPAMVPLAVICTASVLAGHVAYRVGGSLSRFALFRRLIARSRTRVDRLFARYGVWAVAVGSVTPVPYSILCYLSGLYKIPYGLFALLTLLRIPRILFFYFLFRAGWSV